ncbi:hypothetical protein BDQ12DRAFT_694403 [Crucibulum laeve]|uniref:Uncharacterized protein n=1 Tax=Crucibulum laeve TaxID=68775 RepID=A0A5C3LEG1_9AGAR|nr:hypothetical protein BDQ12DRAFT_694403 [Crucibulum laeve]
MQSSSKSFVLAAIRRVFPLTFLPPYLSSQRTHRVGMAFVHPIIQIQITPRHHTTSPLQRPTSHSPPSFPPPALPCVQTAPRSRPHRPPSSRPPVILDVGASIGGNEANFVMIFIPREAACTS